MGLRRAVNVYVIVTLVNFCITLEFLLAPLNWLALPTIQVTFLVETRGRSIVEHTGLHFTARRSRNAHA